MLQFSSRILMPGKRRKGGLVPAGEGQEAQDRNGADLGKPKEFELTVSAATPSDIHSATRRMTV
jgi:hypothetical protein